MEAILNQMKKVAVFESPRETNFDMRVLSGASKAGTLYEIEPSVWFHHSPDIWSDVIGKIFACTTYKGELFAVHQVQKIESWDSLNAEIAAVELAKMAREITPRANRSSARRV